MHSQDVDILLATIFDDPIVCKKVIDAVALSIGECIGHLDITFETTPWSGEKHRHCT